MAKKPGLLTVIVFAALVALVTWNRPEPAGETAPLKTPEISGTAIAAAAEVPAGSVDGADAIPPAPHVGETKTWGRLLSQNGRPLDLEQLSAHSTSGKVTVGRVAVFEAGSVPLEDFQQGQEIVIPLPGPTEIRGIINLRRIDTDGSVRLGGGLTSSANGSFALSQSDGRIGGRILLRNQELAYLVSSLSSGDVMLEEVALSDVLCHPLPRMDSPEPEFAPVGSEPMAAPPELRSRPEAVSVLYLDFDGATVTDPDWNNGTTINAAPSPLSSTQITQVWSRVKEDFWPFNLNVTTVESDYINAPVGRRMRVIITPTDTASPGSGGVAYRDSFASAGSANFSSDIPCWVFNSWTDAIVETISHEAGHTLGLRHDGRNSPVEEYYGGHSGSVSWGPIMGASFYVQLTQWSKGEYPNANNQEDDLAIISGAQATPLYNLTNNIGVVADDHGDERASATALDVSNYSIYRAGTIATSSDSDYYTFTVGSSRKLILSVVPPNNYYTQANLDAQVELQNAGGSVLMSADPDSALGAALTTTVPAGTYYLRVRSAALAANTGYHGYSAYGSIGSYTLSGTLEDVVAPSITSNPQASYNLYAGNSVSLSATAVGTTPVVYQWKRNGVALANTTRISGATSNYLSITNLTLDDAGTYTMTASNAAGSATTTGSSVVITLPPAPSFSGAPTARASCKVTIFIFLLMLRARRASPISGTRMASCSQTRLAIRSQKIPSPSRMRATIGWWRRMPVAIRPVPPRWLPLRLPQSPLSPRTRWGLPCSPAKITTDCRSELTATLQ